MCLDEREPRVSARLALIRLTPCISQNPITGSLYNMQVKSSQQMPALVYYMEEEQQQQGRSSSSGRRL